MNLITVIPLTRAKVADELSYFTAAEIPVGSIVSVPLRSKSIHGIVTRSENAENLKLDIKNATFAIKKLDKVRATVFFPPAFMSSAKQLADYYATTIGSVINALVPATLLEHAAKIPPPLPAQASFGMQSGSTSTTASGSERIFAVQGDGADRLSSWRSLIRQEFARKRSIVMYAPTIEECERLYAELLKGIEGYIFILHGNLTAKKTLETWTAISNTTHPVVVIATASFSLLPRSDIETAVIERENGRGWITPKAPYLDMRQALEYVSRALKRTIFIADSLLSTETLSRVEKDEIDRGSPFKWRAISDATDKLIDMKVPSATPDSPHSPGFRVLSSELEELIHRNREDNTHLFIMTLRRGHSPSTVCQDCGTVVLCRQCSAPVVLYTSSDSGRNFFMCHLCGERRSANEMCATCGGWRLAALGIGIDRVREAIEEIAPKSDIFKIDADTTANEKQIVETMRTFYAKPGSVLLGTELALLRLKEKIDHTAVVSLDSLFALPDFRIHEKIMYTLTRLREQTTRTLLVQTRKPEEKVFEYGLKGNLSDFHRTSIAERKQFAYPPYSVLIKISLEGVKDTIAEAMAQIRRDLEPRELDIFPAFTATVRGRSAIHGLIKIERHAWPDPELIAKLRSLPPNVTVKVNPETLL